MALRTGALRPSTAVANLLSSLIVENPSSRPVLEKAANLPLLSGDPGACSLSQQQSWPAETPRDGVGAGSY